MAGISFPLITIGLPCYNAEDTIERAVAAALAQTWTEREILIVDDGSSDRSESILESLACAHPDIRIVRHKTNAGGATALNTLLREAEGEFIAFFGDDDESDRARLARQHERIVTYEAQHECATVFCYSDRLVVQPGKQAASFERAGIGRGHPAPCGNVVADFALGLLRDDGPHQLGALGSGTMMGRTSAFRRMGGFDPDFRRAADEDFAVRAALAGAHFISVDAPLITQHVTTTPDKGAHIELRCRLLLMRKHKSYLRAKRAYLGARCNAHARFCRTQGFRRWRMWYFAALVCFPLSVSRERLIRSTLVGRLKPVILLLR